MGKVPPSTILHNIISGSDDQTTRTGGNSPMQQVKISRGGDQVLKKSHSNHCFNHIALKLFI